MTIRKRLAALEAGAAQELLSPAVRAWLGQQLTPAEIEQAAIEATQPIEIDWSKVSKEARIWVGA